MPHGLGWVLAAYAVVLAVLGGYAVSLVRRSRRLRRELEATRAERARQGG